tara:strand:+ start:2877 stop:3371 length:495 start_codon:yes stop_codon:yes gene_type:complete
MRDNIKEVAEGRLAIKNDSTVKELREVVKLCFPTDIFKASGCNEFYFKHADEENVGEWDSSDTTNFPTISVKDLLEWTPVRGEVVMVSVNKTDYHTRIFVAYIEGSEYPNHCVNKDDGTRFLKGDSFNSTKWRYMKRKEEDPVTEMTIEQLEEKYSITNLKIIK